MYELSKFSDLYFDNEKINDSLAIEILRNHISKMENNNPNKVYDAILTETKDLLVSFEKNHTNVDV